MEVRMVKKISIIGAGRVGESTAQKLAIKQLAETIVVIDLDDAYAKGVALDIQETASAYGFDTQVIGSNNIETIQGSNIVIITAGIPRKPGMNRDDVLSTNIKIIDKIMNGVIEFAPDSYVILVSNPVDVLTYYANKKANWPNNRIIGQAGILDSMRMSAFIAEKSNYSINDISSMVLGGHGDLMVPMTRFTTIAGISIDNLLGKSDVREIIERTRNGGAEILGLKKSSSAYNAPSSAVEMMVEAIVHNKKRILPCIAMLDGEYGQADIAIGVPVVLGADGVEEIIELELNLGEKEAFDKSAKSIRELLVLCPAE
jgi:malate dehydrogenase